ncbi:MAG: hypothetical protein LBT86_08565 [Deltaproteobacteria bacterium]|jgi:hypothetical protein|nr:hypothetical protein [Deltaproteobacteria bacterium]
MTLTKVESFFRSIKSDLGLRPNFHLKDDRIDGHFYISILAYQCVNWIRNRLSFYNINNSWKTIVNKMSSLYLSRVGYTTPKGYTERYQAVDIIPVQGKIFDAI